MPSTTPLRRTGGRRSSLLVLSAVLGLACSSGSTPPPNPPAIGATGGTVSDGSGASVVVPPGALGADLTIRVAKDSTGAPALPTGLAAAGATYVITPHGGDFAQPVEVRIPAPGVTLQPNQELKLAKAQPGGEWLVLGDSTLTDGVLSAQVSSFSYFVPVTITYALPLAQLAPLQVSTSLVCEGQNCGAAFGAVTATYTVTTNGGALPANCANGSLWIQDGSGISRSFPTMGSLGTGIPLSGGSLSRTLTTPMTSSYIFVLGLRCDTYRTGLAYGTAVTWINQPPYPYTSVLRAPAQLDVVEGLGASLEVVLAGGASQLQNGSVTWPTQEDRAVIDWERSDDGGGSWRTIARSYQDDANPNPVGDGYAWRWWSVRHGFVASASDQGALIRVSACYTPPDVPAVPCVTGPATRLNVLQQSALPRIVDAPRSVLVTAGQTATFFATAGGAPAPTLQWQTRAANDTGAWTDVSTGTGGATGSYTTAVLTLADNGRQYRVVASNALGSAESAAVTASVSDLDVAPTITTQPASLAVMAGSDAAFAVAARGTEALGYQWRLDGTPIAGATGPVLRLAAVTAANAGGYSVVVSNAAGSAASDVAILTVSPGAPAPVAPTIVTQPASVVVDAGNTATFAVGVSGTGPLTFQWRKGGADVAGATSAAITLVGVAAGDAGLYSVVVGNVAGTVTSADATLAVTTTPPPVVTPPSISTQPSTLVVAPGAAATLAVAASGSGPLTYQWSLDGTPVAGATGPVLTIASVGAAEAGSYTVTISNGAGTATSLPAPLILVGAPVITAQPAAASVIEASTANFSVTATGAGLRYQWLRNGVMIAGATGGSHTTLVTALADSGSVFSVLVYNGAGLVLSQPAVLTVTAAPVGRLALVANSNANTLSIFRADAGTGALTSLGTTGTGAYPYAIAVTPNGTYAYVTNLGGNSVSSYSVDASAGTVTMLGSSVNSVNPYGIAMDPLGRFVWVANYSAHTVSAYTINGSTGQLAAAGAPVATGTYPYAVAAHPSGNYVYVANEMGNSVSAYSVNTSTGQLTLLAGTIANSAYRPHGIAVDPTGRFAYVVESGGSSVAAFSINASTGVLTVVGYASTGTSPSAVAVHPNGQYVYVANQGPSTVSLFAINGSTGALTAVGSPIATGASPAALAVSAAGSYLYAANLGGNSSSAFSISATTGALTSLGADVPAGSGAQGIATTP